MIERVVWGLLALVHLVPALALVRPALIERLYGVAPGGDVFVLLHHRAALFAAICAACVWAVFEPGSRPLAGLVTTISVVAFLVIYVMSGQPPALRTIALADLALLPALLFVLGKAWIA